MYGESIPFRHNIEKLHRFQNFRLRRALFFISCKQRWNFISVLLPTPDGLLELILGEGDEQVGGSGLDGADCAGVSHVVGVELVWFWRDFA